MFAEVQRLDTPQIEYSLILPLLILIGGAVVLLVASALVPKRAGRLWHSLFTIGTSVAAIVSAVFLWFRLRKDGPTNIIAEAVRVDTVAVFAIIVIAAGVILTVLLTQDYLRRERLEGAEAYVLLMLSASGGIIMAMANDLLVLFLGLEILSIATYVLAGIHIRRLSSGEAALKYFVLGAFSSAFLIYGVALVYGATGSTNLADIHRFFAEITLTNDVAFIAGIAFILVGLGFKVSAAPFHAWAPDVYDGSPSPVVAYMASAVKAAGFIALIRIFVLGFGMMADDWRPLLYILSILTMAVGAFLAITQTSIKRMLAYSSINHAGFMLMGIQAGTLRGTAAVLFYLASYTFMVAGSFGIATVVGRVGDAAHDISEYRGLARRSPFLAFSFLVFLLGQAGVPFTAGFIAKFWMIGAAVDARSFWLGLVGMLTAVVSAYVYLRIIIAMYAEENEADAEAGERPARLVVPTGARLAIGAAVIVTLGLGIYPQPLLSASRTAADTSPAVVVEQAPSVDVLAGP